MRVLVELLSLIGRHLTVATAARVGGTLGMVAWRLGVRRRLVSETLARVMKLRGLERAAVARQSYASIGATMLAIWTVGGRDGLERHVTVANPRWLAHLRKRHGGLVIATSHLGDWDGAALGVAPLVPRLLVYAKSQGGSMDETINRLRQATGGEVLITRRGDRTGAVTVLRALRDGAVVGLLADQRPRIDEGLAAWFLGEPTYVHPGPAFFAKRLGLPVLPGFSVHRRSGEVAVYFGRPIRVDHLEEPAASQVVMDALGACIASVPGQYFWQHNRFKDRAELPLRTDDAWRGGVAWLRNPPGN